MESSRRPDSRFMSLIFENKARMRRNQANLPVREKLKILIELQRIGCKVISQRRKLEWWERPWEIE